METNIKMHLIILLLTGFIFSFSIKGEDGTTSTSNKPTLNRRQFSQTQSEPETSDLPASASGNLLIQQPSFDRNNVTFTEPKIKVVPPSSRGSILMHMHSEYASITDELETVCGLLSPPKSPGLLSPPRPEQSPPSSRKRNLSEMSNPELAINLEKEHLRSAEECDYMVMENLIQRRYEEELEDEIDTVDHADLLLGESSGVPNNKEPALLSVVAETREFRVNSWPARQQTLQRSQAIDSDSASTQGLGSSSCSSTDRQDSTESRSSSTTGASGAQHLKRPSIVLDSSHLPVIQQREVLQKAESKNSLHMQSETMC